MDGISRRPTLPFGINLARKISGKDFGVHEHRALVLFLTFVAYMLFHASRKPLSIVKSVLDPDVSQRLATDLDAGSAPSPATSFVSGWPPFDGVRGAERLGEIDVAFLASYAIGMYFAGRLGDTLDLRRFLTFGMVGSGAFVCVFGMGYWWNIHTFYYYFLVQIFVGLLSAIGWPAVVSIVGNWFGKAKRGLIMGFWNAHASVGNIVGSVVAAAALKHGWGWSFVFPAIAIMICGIFVFLFLVVEPAALGLPSPYEVDQLVTAVELEESRLLLTDSRTVAESNGTPQDASSHPNAEMPISVGVDWVSLEPLDEKIYKPSSSVVNCITTHPTVTDYSIAIGFYEAWCIPGVAQYAFCLFFIKLVAYTFLFWLPFYIKHTEIAGQHLSDKMAGYLSTIFDIGGVMGGILAGHLSDRYNVNAVIAISLVYCAIPSLYLFRVYGQISLFYTITLMMISGIFVNGPYALITTAVSADLGTHSSLKGNAKALATVTAIIDGTGSVGAAIGPFLTGYIAVQSWNSVFLMLAVSSFIGGLFLTKLVVVEILEKVQLYRGLVMTEIHQQEPRETVS